MSSETVWSKQLCTTKRINLEVCALRCIVTTPDQGTTTKNKAFGLEISILGKKIVMKYDMIPNLVCEVDNRIKSYKHLRNMLMKQRI